MTKDNVNYCHDPEILAIAKKLGVTDRSIINRALSFGEAGAYRSIEASEEFLILCRRLDKFNKEIQPKQRLSKRKKLEILQRNGR